MDRAFDEQMRSTLRSSRPTGFYDTVELQVITSPRRFSVMRSQSPRFDDRARERGLTSTPFGTYNVTRPFTNPEAMLPHRYYVFASGTGRSRPESNAADIIYNVEAHRTLRKEVDESALTYSAMRSAIPRFRTTHKTAAPDKYYNVDFGQKMSLTTSMENSSYKFSIMKTSTERFRSQFKDSTPGLLGPGAYNPELSVFDLRKLHLPKQPAAPAFGSKRARFGGSNRGY